MPSPPVEIVDANLTAHDAGQASDRSAVLAAEGATVYVFSSDPGFQAAIEDAAKGDYSVTPVEEWQELVAEVEAGRAKILLLDADAIRSRVEWRITRLKAAAEWCVIMIAADRDRAPSLMELLWQHQIHRLVMKPLGQGVARILMESAVGRYRLLRDDPSVRDSPAVRERANGASPLARLRPRNPLLIAAYLSIAVALAILIRVVVLPSLTPDETAPVVTEAAIAEPEPAIPFAAELEEQLRLAREAESRGWLTGPSGESAMDHYLGILEYDPTHAEATVRLGALLDGLFGQAEAELLAESPDLAALTLEKIRRVRPDHSRLAFLQRQLDIVLERTAEAPPLADLDFSSPIPVVAAIPALSELDSLLTVADVRLQNDQLLLPEGDSAFDYVRRAEAISLDDPIVVETRSELVNALAAAAWAEFDSGAIASAERHTAAARELGSNDEALTALDAEIAALRAAAAAEAEAARLATLLSSAEERLEQGDLVEPEDDSALFYLDSLRSENPDYPNLDATWQRLTDEVAANTAAAIGAGNWESAESWLAVLERVADDSELATGDLRTELEVSRLREEFLSVPVAPSELVLLEASPSVYPQEAQQSGVEGWVDLEFIVGLDGLVAEVSVTGAEPVGVFEQAAIDAISTHRYEPFEFGGRGYERLLSLRIRFTLQ
ncbi:MAG TPA: energy transducer TonB [Gammaproteobacteria bacterium]